MKTQFSFKQYGFTLVEIMVTIAILIFLSWITLSFNTNPQQHLARAERLANKIADTLHDALSFIQIGRMDNSIPPQAVTGALLTFVTGTGGRIQSYYNDTLNTTSQAPYYDSDTNYTIESIAWTGGLVTPTGTASLIQILISPNVITFSGAGIDTTAPIVTFTSRYMTRAKKVIFDRRTGRIEVNKE
jgi:Tfp pilus assembly protein FimT